MLAAFCLRLGLGMLAPLPLLPAGLLHPKFYRTQFLIALGLAAVATVGSIGDETPRLVIAILAGILALMGSVAWSLEPAPHGKLILNLCALAFLAGACRPIFTHGAEHSGLIHAVDGITSGLLMGAALTAMLVGHSYLISPGMTLMPLNRMLGFLFATLLARAALAGVSLILWSRHDADTNLSVVYYWLPVRWLVGLFAPAGFALMAWLTARIRSTQSATGILYVVVICVFLGELVGMLLLRTTGLPL